MIKDLVTTCIETIEKAYERRGAVSGLQTGFKEFDLLTNGLHCGELTVVASPRGMGKTTFALNIVDQVAVVLRKGVAVFSLGIDAKHLVRRLLSAGARVHIDKVRDGFLQERDFPNLMLASSKLMESSIYVDDSELASVAELRTKAKAFGVDKPIELIVVDNLQRLYLSSQQLATDRSKVFKELKQMAVESQVPVLALAKLADGEKCSTDEWPFFNRYKEAEFIEEYADAVGILELPMEEPEPKNSRRSVAEKSTLRIVKNGNGPLGEVTLQFQKEYLRFEDANDSVRGAATRASRKSKG